MKNNLNQSSMENIPNMLPVIPTMDVVVFPHMIVPLLVLDEKIIRGVNRALQEDKMVLLLAARKQENQHEAIGTKDLYDVGTVASIMRLIKIPEGGIKILVQGICKARTKETVAYEDGIKASIDCTIPMQTSTKEDVAARIKNIKMLTEKMALGAILLALIFILSCPKCKTLKKLPTLFCHTSPLI
ncbi:hypothetical protein Noda2021_00140 [Candidatus Dependentiae bacterium Noda2021]|nr:hypothetical protein Noda2021_00140 [Candidatus Dependentiae bacterium Noda2021]